MSFSFVAHVGTAWNLKLFYVLVLFWFRSSVTYVGAAVFFCVSFVWFCRTCSPVLSIVIQWHLYVVNGARVPTDFTDIRTALGPTVFSSFQFLRATAGTAIARLSHRNSVCLSVRLSVTRVDHAKTMQARVIKSSPSAATRTLVSGSVTLFQKFRRGHPNRGP